MPEATERRALPRSSARNRAGRRPQGRGRRFFGPVRVASCWPHPSVTLAIFSPCSSACGERAEEHRSPRAACARATPIGRTAPWPPAMRRSGPWPREALSGKPHRGHGPLLQKIEHRGSRFSGEGLSRQAVGRGHAPDGSFCRAELAPLGPCSRTESRAEEQAPFYKEAATRFEGIAVGRGHDPDGSFNPLDTRRPRGADLPLHL